MEWSFSNGWSSFFNFNQMPQIIFIAVVAATAYTSGLSFVLQ
jgi:hypothetical protein